MGLSLPRRRGRRGVPMRVEILAWVQGDIASPAAGAFGGHRGRLRQCGEAVPWIDALAGKPRENFAGWLSVIVLGRSTVSLGARKQS